MRRLIGIGAVVIAVGVVLVAGTGAGATGAAFVAAAAGAVTSKRTSSVDCPSRSRITPYSPS